MNSPRSATKSSPGAGRRPTVAAGVDLIPVDLAAIDSIEPALDRADPDSVIHAAAISSAEAVRLDRPRAEAINVRATRRISEWAESRRRRVVFTSTDLVFDGTRPFRREDDPAEPVLAYGQTKRAAELALAPYRSAVVARLPLLFGLSRCGRPSFFDRAIEALRRGEPQSFFEDEYRTPLDYGSAARGLGPTRLDRRGRDHPPGGARADEPVRPDGSIRQGDGPGCRLGPGEPALRRQFARAEARRRVASTRPGGASSSPTRFGRRSRKPSRGFPVRRVSQIVRWGV